MASTLRPRDTVAKQRYVPNTPLPQGLPFMVNPETNVRQALEHIVTQTPPQTEYPLRHCHGLLSGPTALALLFLKVGAVYPAMKIRGHPLRYWADRYIGARRIGAQTASCGLISENAGFWTVRTLIDGRNAPTLGKELDKIITDTSNSCELFYGYAGLLYMIRLVELWQPDHATSFTNIKERIVDRIMTAGPNWTWHDKRYIGVAHGDMGILTQLVLTDPNLATGSFAAKLLERLLSQQQTDGNWPAKENEIGTDKRLIQLCHGAPGFIVSLQRLRPFFTRMEGRIDEAIRRGREAIWEEGLLRKEPCLCHGILGNALAFPPGARRDHFLAWSLPEKVIEERERDRSIFVPRESNNMSLWMDYWPSAVWSWLASSVDVPGIILYNDL